MRTVSQSKEFAKRFSKLPRLVQEKIEQLIPFLLEDLRHSKLHTKKLQGTDELYSFRAGREYRILFELCGDEIILLISVKHRKDMYKRLR
jgi:mRNA-degrading endonuclease RelE of RelBE toxin-antitoxin system